MDPITAQVLISRKLEFLRTVADTSMQWWVSSVLFCASVLGAMWSRRIEVMVMPYKRQVGFLLTFFFGSIVLYGALVTAITLLDWFSARQLLDVLRAPEDLFNSEFLWILLGVPVGTSSFVLFLVVFRMIWRFIVQEERSQFISPTLPSKEHVADHSARSGLQIG